MPGLQGETAVAAVSSPVRKSRLSLKFLQKKETKRALDFSEPQADEAKSVEPEEPEASSCDQVVPGPCPASPGLPLSCEKKESLVPFVGFNNLGNTCYLNSVLQVLYHCPGLREGIKKLYNLSKTREKPKEETDNSDESSGVVSEDLPAQLELVGSFNSLITSVEQLQSSFLLSPDSFSEGELATPPRKILHTLRQLNPMYEGYLQHDAQEVLQCILGYIQEACETIRKEQGAVAEVTLESVVKLESVTSTTESQTTTTEEEDGLVSGKRKSDTEVGNAKKKPKSVKAKKSDSPEDTGKNRPLTRSKRKSSSDITQDNKDGETEEEEKKKVDKEETQEGGSDGEGKGEKETKEGKKKKKAKLSWLRPSGKQPSIFSKFRSMGKISSMTTGKNQMKAEPENTQTGEETLSDKSSEEKPTQNMAEDKKAIKQEEGLDLMERLFQGQLVLRTRCLECESFTERREDFQDISVPVLDDQPSSPDDLGEVSPDPKPELKTLKWAIGQFASVERIVGEDKYFCETCHHYTEAERSLLFDKTPEVITIHLKRFSANGLELDPYAGLSKVNTPLQTPLTLSLEEWCTRPSSAKGQTYQLFAVVMHSGVTISSGHYTSYVRVSNLKHAKLCLKKSSDGKETGDEEEEKKIKEGTRGEKGETLDYDDGEVSFSVNSKGQKTANSASGKTGAKKVSEGNVVGLLGGQRSLSSSYDIGNSTSKHTEKAASSGATEGSKRRKTVSQNTEAGIKKETGSEEEATEQQALNNLLEFEGKWLLFDDSEVRLFEEDEFLRACSPEMCSSSTPYLLFYRRMPEPAN